MRSRLLIGASGWLLGAAAATCGSMLAVSHLAHGLLGPGTQQLSVADVRNDLASSQRATVSPQAPAKRAESASPASVTPHARPSRIAAARPAPAPVGTLLVSKAGSAMASCQSGLAYIQYWSPAQGYQADDVLRGPAAQVRLEFESAGTGLTMTISCSGGQPIDHLSSGSDDDGVHHDE